jgi:ATP-dependent DNA helicase RecG
MKNELSESGAFTTSIGDIEAARKSSVKPSETAPKTAPKSTRDRIILLLRQDPRLTKQDLMRMLGKASGTIKEHIRILQKEGDIRHIGPAKGGHWEVIDNEDIQQ